MTNVTILGVFRTHAQKEYGKISEMKNTYILNIVALFFKLEMHLLKVWSNSTWYKDVKWGVEVESARFHGFINGESHLLPTMPNYTNFKNIRVIWKFGVCNHVN